MTCFQDTMFYIKRAIVALGLVLLLSCTVHSDNPRRSKCPNSTSNLCHEFGLDGYEDETTWFDVGSQLRMIGIH